MSLLLSPPSSAPTGAAAGSVLVAVDDAALLSRQRDLIAARREIDAALAEVAAEIARRSARTHGYAGLAARHGARSAEQFIAQETGLTVGESKTMIGVGSLEGESAVRGAVSCGAVSVAAAGAVLRGLGAPSGAVDASTIDRVAAELLDGASGATPEELSRDARTRRAELDAQSVIDRERELHRRRSLRITRMPDGMTRLIALLDPESAAEVVAVVDAATSPRRGGPRFVDATERARSTAIVDDPRTTEQLALDVVVTLLRLGAEVEPGRLLGHRRPAVRIHVTDRDLARRAGRGWIEGESAPVSIATAERRICEAGTVPIRFDTDGQVVNVGRDQRCFTARQRIGLAARDGGCRWPGCDRPPSWCEAHHIDEWHRHGGRTDLADGLLLCRFHHLLVHDRGWRIRRDGAEYRAMRDRRGPNDRDPSDVPLPSRTPLRLEHGLPAAPDARVIFSNGALRQASSSPPRRGLIHRPPRRGVAGAPVTEPNEAGAET